MANAKQQKFKPAQNFVPIQEVRDGIVLLKDGPMRAILMTSTINFALKSEDEQIALLSQFQSFLNSLDFSIQLFVQSRDLDIRPYIAKLEDIFTQQTNELMRVQTREYIEFVKSFVENTSIMTKRFFIIVPYEAAMVSAGKGGVSFGGGKQSAADILPTGSS